MFYSICASRKFTLSVEWAELIETQSIFIFWENSTKKTNKKLPSNADRCWLAPITIWSICMTLLTELSVSRVQKHTKFYYSSGRRESRGLSGSDYQAPLLPIDRDELR